MSLSLSFHAPACHLQTYAYKFNLNFSYTLCKYLCKHLFKSAFLTTGIKVLALYMMANEISYDIAFSPSTRGSLLPNPIFLTLLLLRSGSPADLPGTIFYEI